VSKKLLVGEQLLAGFALERRAVFEIMNRTDGTGQVLLSSGSGGSPISG
jgi:hypothetical protein